MSPARRRSLGSSSAGWAIAWLLLPGCFEIDPSYGETDEVGDSSSAATTEASDGRDPMADDDQDGILNAQDNCPDVANEGQEDEDGDTVGDSCDVCRAAGFTDDRADYDGDGIACGEDPCPFDGPSPTAPPDPAGPFTEITVTAADVAGTGRAWALVAPGESITITHDYAITDCGCQNCIDQGYTGVVDIPGVVCWYNGIPACVEATGTASIPLTVPTEPGVYWLAVRRVQDFQCDTSLTVPAQNAFAAFCVME